MGSKRPKPEEIVSKLRQVEVLQGQGMSIADAVVHCQIIRATGGILITEGSGLMV